MRKHDRLPLSPVLIVNLRAVFGRDSAHSLKNWCGYAVLQDSTPHSGASLPKAC
jgi:hypothetical protein